MKLVQKSPNADLMERRRTGAHPLDYLLIQSWKVHQRVMAAPQKSDMQEVGSDLWGPIFLHSTVIIPTRAVAGPNVITSWHNNPVMLCLFYFNKLSLALVLPYTLNEQNQHTATLQCDYSASRHSGFRSSAVWWQQHLFTIVANKHQLTSSSLSPQLAMISFSCL